MCNMDLARPCSNCPFLDSEKSISHTLNPGRLEGIKDGLLNDDMTPFFCHKTTSGEESDEGDYISDGREQVCMGSMAWLQRQGSPSVQMRIFMSMNKEWTENLKKSIPLIKD